jgi:hypothetical protein
MITQNGVPIVSSKTYGLGRVFFLAFDYSSSPFKGWDGHGDMWKRIIYSANTRFPIASPASLAEDNYGTPQRPPSGHNHRKVYERSYVAGFNPIASVASSFPAVTTPSFEIILCFLLGYLICLVPLNYFVFTKKRKELAWITTPAVILIFTLGAYGIGYGMKGGKLLLKTVAVVEAGPNTRYASTTTYSGLFSPARKDYEIEFQDPFAAVSETLPQNNQQPGNQFQLSTDDDTMIRMAETTTIPRLKMDMWATRSFRSESACDLGGTLTTDIRIDATSRKATGTIRNNTDYDLQDCMIIIGTDTVQVVKVRRKSLVSVNASMSKNGPPQPAPVPVPAPYPAGAPAPGPMPTPYAPAPRQPSDPSDETREKLRSQIMPYVTGDGGPALVGWADKTPVQVRLNNGRAAHQTANCFIFWLPEEGGLNP